MLVRFFLELRAAGVPVSITEFLTLLTALGARVTGTSAQDFYYLARASLVKDERHYDRFDLVFAQVFAGAERRFAELLAEVPADWLQAVATRVLSEEDKRTVARARRIQRFMSQPFAVAEQFTGITGKYVKLDETISSFERLVSVLERM